tara:strand:+ start:1551 stop:1979 length:429 start_codon:yes stop_codon:yes gene_type:complete
MSRPMYETAETRLQEQSLIEYCCDKWNMDAIKLPIKYGVDYMAMDKRGKATGFIELKQRTTTKDAYNTYFISLHKMMNVQALIKATELPVTLVVQWTDWCGWVRLDTIPYHSIYAGGRGDRNDWQDREPMVHIPIKNFTLFK